MAPIKVRAGKYAEFDQIINNPSSNDISTIFLKKPEKSTCYYDSGSDNHWMKVQQWFPVISEQRFVHDPSTPLYAVYSSAVAGHVGIVSHSSHVPHPNPFPHFDGTHQLLYHQNRPKPGIHLMLLKCCIQEVHVDCCYSSWKHRMQRSSPEQLVHLLQRTDFCNFHQNIGLSNNF